MDKWPTFEATLVHVAEKVLQLLAPEVFAAVKSVVGEQPLMTDFPQVLPDREENQAGQVVVVNGRDVGHGAVGEQGVMGVKDLLHHGGRGDDHGRLPAGNLHPHYGPYSSASFANVCCGLWNKSERLEMRSSDIVGGDDEISKASMVGFVCNSAAEQRTAVVEIQVIVTADRYVAAMMAAVGIIDDDNCGSERRCR
ncbi:unnamed protein product [Cuscuta campestris]|uniref:Uncharacterized protein n=1 Tax=Cuscuta campestris TaxID=132261 RepID=A0A484LFT7_9ASTE|nr:unnamed protein product [Cuscuta campestris]